MPTNAAIIGLPEVVEEYYYDLQAQNEVLINKIVNEYTPDGYLHCRKTFDAKGEHAYSQKWGYDEYGNVIYELDPMGNEIKRFYDQNSNLIEEIQEGVRIVCEYDYSNRLVRKAEFHEDGSQFEYRYVYDLKGNKISETDRFGNLKQNRYDAFDRPIETVLPAVPTINHEAFYPMETYGYDVQNNKTEGMDANGNTTRKSFNIRGKPCRITYPDGGKRGLPIT